MSSPTIASGGGASETLRLTPAQILSLQRAYMGDFPLPAGTRLISSNVYRSRKVRQVDEDDVQVCSCRDRDAEGPLCAPDGPCENATVKCECIVGFCSRSRCGNMRLQNGSWWPDLRVAEIPGCGLGVRVTGTRTAVKGTFLMEYFGEIVDTAEKDARMDAYARAHRHFYVMALGGGDYVDAASLRSVAAFVNHSCEPNVRVELWTIGAESRVGIFAAADLTPGTELRFDYGWGRAQKLTVCACGARMCRALMNVGVRFGPGWGWRGGQ